MKAPRSGANDWAADNGRAFHSERGIGVLPFLPLLAWLGVEQWIEHAGYPETGILCYGDSEMRNQDKADCVLEFVDFWKQSCEGPRCLIFDSQFTTYQNLERLDLDNIKFITIRRRHKRLLEELRKLSKNDWKEMRLEGDRKPEKVRIHESEITLSKISRPFRQIIVADNGHEKETFLITNDRDRTAPQIVRQYGGNDGI